jgi:hypothetical protein
MVLLKTTLTGIGLLVLGVLLVTALGQYVTVEVREVQRQSVEPHVEFLVGDLADRPYSLPASSQVLGNIIVAQAPSNQTGDIRFLVFDADNYQRWLSGSQADFIYSADKQGEFNYTFTTGTTGIYHFVFDNRASVYKKYVTLTVAYDEVTTSRVPDVRVSYVGWVLLVAGGLIFVYGLVKRPPASWA